MYKTLDQDLFCPALIDAGDGAPVHSCLIYDISDVTARIALAQTIICRTRSRWCNPEKKAKGAGVGCLNKTEST
jgi:hypothetical protein